MHVQPGGRQQTRRGATTAGNVVGVSSFCNRHLSVAAAAGGCSAPGTLSQSLSHPLLLTHTQPYNSTSVQTPPAWNFLQHIPCTPCQGPRANPGSVIKFHLRAVNEAPWADIPSLFPKISVFLWVSKSSSAGQKLSLCISTVTILPLPKADGDA